MAMLKVFRIQLGATGQQGSGGDLAVPNGKTIAIANLPATAYNIVTV